MLLSTETEIYFRLHKKPTSVFLDNRKLDLVFYSLPRWKVCFLVTYSLIGKMLFFVNRHISPTFLRGFIRKAISPSSFLSFFAFYCVFNEFRSLSVRLAHKRVRVVYKVPVKSVISVNTCKIVFARPLINIILEGTHLFVQAFLCLFSWNSA